MSGDQFTNGIWAKSFEVFRRNLAPSAFYVAGMVLIGALSEFLDSTSGMLVGQIFITALLAIIAHLTVLKNVAGFAAMPKANGGGLLTRFAWRTVVLGAMAMVPMFTAIFALLEGGYGQVIALAVSMLVLLFVAASVFAAWGTMLPACVMGNGYGFSEATARGKQTFSYVLPRLLVSFGLLSLPSFALVIGASVYSGRGGNFFPNTGGFDFPVFVGVLAANTIGAFQVVMTAVILSRAYLMAEAQKSA